MRRLLVLLGLLATSASPFACASFRSTEGESPGGGDASNGADVDVTFDGGHDTPAGDGGPASTCGVPLGAACSVPCATRKLYLPKTTRAPWGIATTPENVFWVEQLGSFDGYNGHGYGVIMRTDRVGSTDATRATQLVLLQPRATEIAVDGGWLYWAVRTDGGATILRRVKTDCSAPCTVDAEVPLPGLGLVLGIVRIRAGELLVAADSGHVVVVDTTGDMPVAKDPIATLGGPAAIAASSDHFYAATAGDSRVFRADVLQRNPEPAWVTLPAGPAAGYGFIGASCDDLFGIRAQRLEALPLAGAVPRALGDGWSSVFDLRADTTHAWLGIANAGGVFAVSPTDGGRTPVWTGNVFRIAVDDDGVYWGDHAEESGGALWMMVKR